MKEAQEAVPRLNKWPVYSLDGKPMQARRRQRTVRNQVQEKGVKPLPRPKRGAEAGWPVQRTQRAAYGHTGNLMCRTTRSTPCPKGLVLE